MSSFSNINDLSEEHILRCTRAIFHLTKEQLKAKNALFDGESQPLFMQVTCIRIPETPRRCMRIVLPHSMVSETDEVALFVGDLERGRRKDYEPTVEHYEDLLRKHGCTRIKSVIPMNQVKTEYDQYELKRKLVDSYDHFLVDGKIAGHLSHLLGSEFYKKRKLPTPVRMQSKDLKHEIEHGLKKTLMPIHPNGDTHVVQVGHSCMKEEQILDNILATCTFLSKHYPGGWTNVRCVRLKTRTSLGLPIYTTLKNKNSVQIPTVRPKRPKAYHQVSGEISTVASLDSVTVTPEGDVIVQQKRKRYGKRNIEQNK
ncbi:ribosomal L1 domain-containing protein 1-like [Ceratina calcarata]|uniref:Ribosomal L1 domain-containing protein 1-like n=1 Tax=Ceratina calcarata TaxID=156304 RepID=A0AAJ7NBU4_9HYME|nr:ribosomal L1 domain-containing protein 1-like [Ceratina calcarata]